MNNGRFYIFSALLFTALFIVPSSAAAKTDFTIIRGNVYDQDNGGKGIKGLNVEVTCNEDKKKNDKTDKNGLYTVKFSEKKCPKYKPVTAEVTYNGQTQTQTVYVSDQNTATLDFYFGTPISVPEFGFIPGVIAALSSAGAFLALKKKSNS